jgi:hypothetical protein
MRGNAVNLMLVLAAAVISLVSFDGTISHADLGPCAMITATGIAGPGWSIASAERYDHSRNRAEHRRDRLDTLVNPGPRDRVRQLLADADRHRRYPSTLRLRTAMDTHVFWLLLPAVAAAGIWLTLTAVTSSCLRSPASAAFPASAARIGPRRFGDARTAIAHR